MIVERRGAFFAFRVEIGRGAAFAAGGVEDVEFEEGEEGAEETGGVEGDPSLEDETNCACNVCTKEFIFEVRLFIFWAKVLTVEVREA